MRNLEMLAKKSLVLEQLREKIQQILLCAPNGLKAESENGWIWVREIGGQQLQQTDVVLALTVQAYGPRRCFILYHQSQRGRNVGIARQAKDEVFTETSNTEPTGEGVQPWQRLVPRVHDSLLFSHPFGSSYRS